MPVTQKGRPRPIGLPWDEVTFMFTDLEGSTGLIDGLGDRRALRIMDAYDHLIRAELPRFFGREVEQRGDGFWLVFPDARLALSCAIAIQKSFAAYAAVHPRQVVRVRIGVHSGRVIRYRHGFFGKDVVVAARIMNEAKGGEILISERVREAVDGIAGIALGASRIAELKGLQGPYRLHSAQAVARAEDERSLTTHEPSALHVIENPARASVTQPSAYLQPA
jgi:class 3 adenylate cyclase